MRFNRYLALAGALSSFCAVQAQQYQFVDLQPAGVAYSQGLAISNGQQAGLSDVGAVIWSGSAGSMVNLAAGGAAVNATDGVQQGGYVGQHAALWTGTAASMVDLNPAGADASYINAVSGGRQLGLAIIGGYSRAMLWSGTAASAINLHPAGYDASTGTGMAGDQMVGMGLPNNYNFWRGLLWQGSSNPPIDITPASWPGAYVLATDGTTQVGFVQDYNFYHAALWHGSADTFVDLNGTQVSSQLLGLGGGKQVGFIYDPTTPGLLHAAVWSGTSASMVDLQNFTPTTDPGSTQGQWLMSIAQGIDAQGNIVGWVTNTTTGYSHACMWVPVHINMLFLQPVQDSGGSVFKQGSTIPLKLSITDPHGFVSGATVTISVFLVGDTSNPVNEDYFETPADNGVLFRQDGQQYIYNLGTKGLKRGAQYLIVATANGVSHSVTISLN